MLKSKVTLFKFAHLQEGRPVPALAWIAAGRDVWERGGVAGFTKGLGVSVVGAAIHNGFLFMGYYSIRSWWSPPDSSWMPFAVGGMAAAVLAQITYPLDLIRRTALHGNLHAYDAAQQLVSRGGWLGLYRGSVANLVKVAPLFAIQFLVYEKIFNAMKRQ